MRTVHALLVGIDDYPGKPLSGCVNDVAAAEEWLRRQDGIRPEILRLRNTAATRDALLAGLRRHLGRTGPGETALFWFSGHGSEQPTSDPRAATGMSQALVCADSLDPGGQPLLWDAELGAVLREIASRGGHVVAVIDSCHSGGVDRDAPPGTETRGVAWQPWWVPTPSGAPRGAGGPAASAGADHILLAGCREYERAHEAVIDGVRRGYFSHALLGALDLLGPAASFGKVHALAETDVLDRHRGQHPELRGPEHLRFLYGDPLPDAPFLLRHTTAGWEVNCGAVHGLRSAGAEFTLQGGAPAALRTVVVREVRAESSLVEPLGWTPAPSDLITVHGVTPSALAFPPAAVSVVGDPAAAALMTEAVEASPLLDNGGHGLPLLVEARHGRARVSGGGGADPGALPLRTAADAARVADCLAHISRWRGIRDLANPDPWLSSQVRVSVEPLVGEVRYAATGEIVCAYTPDGREPQVMVRVHNHSPRMLWCVLLDLTDTYASSPHLLDGDFVGAGRAATARAGEPVWFRLPPGRSLRRGAFTHDWLRVVIAENEFNLAPFRLPAWSATAPGGTRAGTGSDGGGLLRLAPTGGRDAGGPPHEVGRWGTTSVVIRTEVP
ncbi:caspase family protein [Streptomyces sp. NRRL F-5727]|uniref:caspase family protein n=1 Tax=Streptomyces sp. NRRL F-5727 TaxID=1463871 RepID=UPI0004C9306D|nr:caspase family protein [Streptomyces sp. NRRL F-5727]